MRRWVLVGCAALACSFDSAFSEPGSGSASVSEGSTSESTGGTTSAGSSGGMTGSMDPTESTPEDPTEAPTGDPTLEPTDSASSSSTTTGAETSSSSGGPSSPLSDEGLVARYFLDEASAGSDPGVALDAADEPFDLPLDYAQAMHYVSELGRRGLAFDQTGADDAARAAVAGTKFGGLDGVTELTFEVVLRVVDALSSSSRIIHVGVGDDSVVTLAAQPNTLEVRWNTTPVRRWDYTAFMGTSQVVHLVVDTTALNEASRFRLLVGGVELAPVIVDTVPQGEPAILPEDAIIALGNRDRDRTFRGVLFYAALYGVALSDDTIAQHVVALQESDDTPE